MQAADRAEFEQHAKALCAGFNVPATPERLEAYWLGLRFMSLGDFCRTVAYALGEHGPERMPTVPALWAIRKASRAAPASNTEQAVDNREAVVKAALALSLSDWQRAAPWSWIVRWTPGVNVEKKQIEQHGAQFVGVIVPEDAKDPIRYPAHRVMA